MGPLLRRVLSVLPFIRKASWRGKSFEAYFRDALDGHGLGEDPLVSEYLARGKAESRLYVRLWAEVREAREVRDSFDLLRRFWVLTASYDALATSGLFWSAAFAVAVAHPEGSHLDMTTASAAGGLALLLALTATHEAARSRSNQVEELTGTYAYLVHRRANPLAAPPGEGTEAYTQTVPDGYASE